MVYAANYKERQSVASERIRSQTHSCSSSCPSPHYPLSRQSKRHVLCCRHRADEERRLETPHARLRPVTSCFVASLRSGTLPSLEVFLSYSSCRLDRSRSRYERERWQKCLARLRTREADDRSASSGCSCAVPFCLHGRQAQSTFYAQLVDASSSVCKILSKLV